MKGKVQETKKHAVKSLNLDHISCLLCHSLCKMEFSAPRLVSIVGLINRICDIRILCEQDPRLLQNLSRLVCALDDSCTQDSLNQQNVCV